MQCQHYRDKYITEAGRARLDAEIAQWDRRLKRLQKKSDDKQARDAGNSGCGARMQDAATMEHETNRVHITTLTLVRQQAQLAPVPTSTDVLRIGCIAVLRYKTTINGKSKDVRHTIEVAGYNDSDCDSVPRRMCYELAMVSVFLGAEVGTSELVFIDGKVRTVTLTAIRLPKKQKA